MANPSTVVKESESTLKSVIDVLLDSQEGYQKIGEKLKNETFKQYFLAESLQRAEFRGNLETVLHQEGLHDIKEHGTVVGTLRNSWGDLKKMLGGGDHTLMVTAEQGEDAAKKVYAEALERNLPLPVRQILASQYAHIQLSHDYVKAARDSTS